MTRKEAIADFKDGSHEILFMDDFDGQMTWRGRWRGNYNVIAWREMPEPYKGE